jgi:nitronate monooxygenase
MRLPSALPIVQAPMAGGPSTPELTSAASAAGAFGFVAAGYLSPDALTEAIAATRALSPAPFGVNLFVPSRPAERGPVDAYRARLEGEAARLGVELGDGRWEDDSYGAKLDVVADAAVHTVTFTFGCPDAGDVERLHRAGCSVGVTVTAADQLARVADAGADFVVAQGTEAGGHQGGLDDAEPNRTPLLYLVAAIREAGELPALATGGVMTGADAAAALAAGAFAVQIGTALLCTPEAGTSTVHRAALLGERYNDTVVTRAYSGRWARGLANRFAREHHEHAPRAYPEVHHLTRPLRAAATRAGDPDVPNLWAGTGWRAVRVEPAAAVIGRIATGIGVS